MEIKIEIDAKYSKRRQIWVLKQCAKVGKKCFALLFKNSEFFQVRQPSRLLNDHRLPLKFNEWRSVWISCLNENLKVEEENIVSTTLTSHIKKRFLREKIKLNSLLTALKCIKSCSLSVPNRSKIFFLPSFTSVLISLVYIRFSSEQVFNHR